MVCSLPVHGILQETALEWGAIAFSDEVANHVLYRYRTPTIKYQVLAR